MVAVSELVDLVAEATEEPVATVRMMARRLIDDDVLPKSVGARIPHVTHEHVASLLFTVIAKPAIKDSARTARAFGALVYNGRPGETALEAMARLLRRLPKHPLATECSVELCTNVPQVVLKQKPLEPTMPHPSERTDYGDIYIPPGDDPMHWPTHGLKRFAVLPGIPLHAIACALTGDE
jgi:hypothetical protein